MSNLEKHGLISATSTKEDGNMSFNWGEPDEVIANRERFLKAHGASLDDCTVMQLNHGEHIEVVGENERSRGARNGPDSIAAEALITNDPETVLFLVTADCLPVTFYDPVKKVLALAHLGWKPSTLGLAKKVIQRMHDEFGCNPADVVVHVGPSIRKESYLVDEISEEQKTPEWQPFITEEADGRYRVDLAGFNKQQLMEVGVPEASIEISSIDTGANENYFSHHRDKGKGGQGRIATIARLPVEKGVQEG
jgi:polyphenol oxidase